MDGVLLLVSSKANPRTGDLSGLELLGRRSQENRQNGET